MPILRSLPDPLSAFWQGRFPFADRDGDGYPDHVGFSLVVSPDLRDPRVWAGILNLVARIAFEVMAFQPPLVLAGRSLPSNKPGVMILPPDRQVLSPVELRRPDRVTAYLSGSSGTSMMAFLNGLATSGVRAKSMPSQSRNFLRKKPGVPSAPDLLNLAGPAGLYHRDESHPRTCRLDASLHLCGRTLSPEVGLSLCDFIARMVLGATEVTLPLAFAGKPEGSETAFCVRETKSKPVDIRLQQAKGESPPRLRLEGTPGALSRSLKQWGSWAFLDSGPGFHEAETLRNHVTEFRAFIDRRRSRRTVTGMQAEPPLKPLRLRSKWKGEVRRILDLAGSVPRGRGKILGEVLVSKPLRVRSALKAGLERLLRHKGYEPQIKVLNAYKPGLSWLLEEILPELQKRSSLRTVEFRYKPDAPAGKTLEMNSRWLQELFPGPELVARSLGLDKSRVRISRRAAQKSVYAVRGLTSKGKVLFKSEFSPRCSEFLYLPQEPELGLVHPTTGGINLRQGDRVILEQTVQTDREVFWRLFQEKWLPLLERHMKRRIDEEPSHGESAFWEEIRLEIGIDETDERLGLGDERVCPMEALHEDLYFVLLDAFSLFSKRHGLSDTLHLGRVVPRVLSKARGGVPSAGLTAKPLAWGRPPKDLTFSRGGRSPVSSMTFKRGAWGLEIREPASDTLLGAAGLKGFNVERCGKNRIRLWVKAPPLQKGGRKAPRWKGNKPPMNRLLKAKEVSHWIERLGRMEGIDTWQASHSLQGRPLWALEATLKKGGALTSLARMRLLKPTFLFNARHHANEISSTSAALVMAWVLGTTPEGQDLLKRVNVVWLPMENPDGVATLEELLPYGRDHKLHAARYNALGVETYGEYFDEEPRFPEPLAKARLWRRWLPDVMVDHHGVPSHEWDQPFSGYAPFRFREFWIPRNFVYACIPFVNEPGHSHHRMAKGLDALLQKAMSGVPDIVRQNREISSRYRRYARGPEPETFPASKGEPLLVLPPLGRTYHTNFAVRHPEVTRSEIIIEVPDEGASGRSLELCVQAHLRVEEALIGAFRRTNGRIESAFDARTGRRRLRWVPGKNLRRG